MERSRMRRTLPNPFFNSKFPNDGRDNEWDDSNCYCRCTQKMVFKWCRVCEIPSEAVDPAENNAKESEYDHP